MTHRVKKISDAQIIQGQRLFEQGDLVSAGKICQQILKENPKNAEGWALWGRITDMTGDNANAVKCFLRAIECAPEEPEYYYNAGQQFLRLANPTDAVPFFEKLLSLKPASAEGNRGLGRAYTYLREYQKAEGYFRKAIELDPKNLETYEHLAYGLEKMNHVDEAIIIINQGIARAPGHSDFLLALAKLQQRSGSKKEAEHNIDKFVSLYKSRPKLSTQEKLKLSSALNEKAKMVEKRKDYDTAYSIFAEGQNYLAEVHDATRKARASANKTSAMSDPFDDAITKARKYFSKDKVRDWPEEIAGGIKPPLFLIGFPRSGTTLMGNILAAHSNMLTLQEEGIIEMLMKRINYPEALTTLPDDQILSLQQSYMDTAKTLLRGKDIGNKTLVDKMPLNNIYLGGIYRIFPNAKILSLLRDPRDTCFSCFTQNFNYNAAMAHFNTLENTIITYRDVMELYLQYKELLPDNMILEVKYEDLISNPEMQCRRIISFAGEEWDPGVLEYYRKENNQYVATPSYEGVMQPIYKSAAGKWRNYAKYFAPYEEILEPFVKKFGY